MNNKNGSHIVEIHAVAARCVRQVVSWAQYAGGQWRERNNLFYAEGHMRPTKEFHDLQL